MYYWLIAFLGLIFGIFLGKYTKEELKEGKKYFILGGGTDSREDNSVYKFKKKFSNRVEASYIGGKIYNKEIFDNYINLWKTRNERDIEYFLKYRL